MVSGADVAQEVDASVLRAGQLIRRVDLYELNVDNMNRLIIDPVSHGVLVTDGGNKKIWAIGPEGEKKAIQFRPWRKRSDARRLRTFHSCASSLVGGLSVEQRLRHPARWLPDVSLRSSEQANDRRLATTKHHHEHGESLSCSSIH